MTAAAAGTRLSCTPCPSCSAHAYLGRMSRLKSCLPDHSSTGLTIAGGGRSTLCLLSAEGGEAGRVAGRVRGTGRWMGEAPGVGPVGCASAAAVGPALQPAHPPNHPLTHIPVVHCPQPACSGRAAKQTAMLAPVHPTPPYHPCGNQPNKRGDKEAPTRHVGHHLADLWAREEAVLGGEQVGRRQEVLQTGHQRGTCKVLPLLATRRAARTAARWPPGNVPSAACAGPPLQASITRQYRSLAPPPRTCVAAIRISPLLGVHRLFITPIRWYASARASSVCSGNGVEEG